MAKVYDTLRLSDRELEQIVDEMERPNDRDISSKRENRRWTIGTTKAIVTTTDESGQVNRQLVVVRNLSSSGCALVMGTFVYPGTACVLTLKDLKGDVRNIAGIIARCRHARLRVHDVGMTFAEIINPREFIEFGDGNAFNTEHVDIEQLKGRVLVIEESRADQKLFAHYFSGSGLELDYAQDGESGIMMLAEYPDMVFVCDQLRDMTGLEVIEQARRRGYGGPVVLLTTESGEDCRAKALASGANEILVKPCLPELLHQAAAEYLLSQATQEDDVGRIESTVDPAVIPNELLCEYIDGLLKQSEEIADAIEKQEIDRLRELLRNIEGASGSYGLEPVSAIAGRALSIVDETGSIGESMLEVQRVIGACQRVRRPE